MLDAQGYMKRDTMEDLEDVRKNVVDDIKTAIVKKNDILKALGIFLKILTTISDFNHIL